MKNDTDFLHSSSLNKYFNFAVNSDPFLICMSDVDNTKGKFHKTSIPVDENLHDSIRIW